MIFRSVYFGFKTLTVADLFELPECGHQYSHLLNTQLVFEIAHDFSPLLFLKDKRQQQKMENKDF